MERYLGLTRDPFSPWADGELYWESDERAELRRRLSDQLLQGCSVRLEGGSGSGRRTLLTRVAGELASGGVPVALFEGTPATDPEEFLAGLAETVGAEPPSGADLLTLAEHLYRRLVEVFCSARPTVVVLPWAPGGAVAEEIGILAELRLLGRSLLSVAVVGSPSLPVGQFEPIVVPDLTTDDLRHCLSHRCAAVGRADLLAPATLERCTVGAPGMPTVLERARSAIRSQVFSSALDATEPPPPSSLPVLDSAQVEEVGRLLDSFSPDTP